MAKKKTTKKRPRRPTKTVASGKVAQVKQPGRRKKAVKKKTTAKKKTAATKMELSPMDNAAATLIPRTKQNSLVEWFNLYLGVEGRAGSDNTFKAKRRDLESFLGFLQKSAGTLHPDQWTRSVTSDFLKYLERKRAEKPDDHQPGSGDPSALFEVDCHAPALPGWPAL